MTINGSNAGADADGISISAKYCDVKNVAIFGFSVAQIWVSGNYNLVENCFVGTTYNGTKQGSKTTGVGIEVTGPDNKIERECNLGLHGQRGFVRARQRGDVQLYRGQLHRN